jgi:hypothetical protein
MYPINIRKSSDKKLQRLLEQRTYIDRIIINP